jgi:hypothetical protein
MAVTKTVLRLTETEAVVKVAGTAAAETIDLQTDLLSSTQVLDGATQTVTIVGMQWTGAPGGIATITRNGTTIMTLQADSADQMMMNGQDMVPDSINATQDIVVTISGAQTECWLRLKKVSGYKSKVEDSFYGSYDDPTRVGASTTKPGSPDYTP